MLHHPLMNSIFEICGFLGIAISTFSYASVHFSRNFVNTLGYPLLNLLSTALFSLSFIQQWNAAACLNNMVWGLISLYGIYNWAKNRTRQINLNLAYQSAE